MKNRLSLNNTVLVLLLCSLFLNFTCQENKYRKKHSEDNHKKLKSQPKMQIKERNIYTNRNKLHNVKSKKKLNTNNSNLSKIKAKKIELKNKKPVTKATKHIKNKKIARPKKALLRKDIQIESEEKVNNSNLYSEKKDNVNQRKENPYKNLEILKDPNVNPQDLPFNLKGENSNFLGLKVSGVTELSNPPFKIERCDQTVQFLTQYIPDDEDYLYREEGFVVINAHFVHLFTKDKKDLIRSILLSQSDLAPEEPRGAKGCIKIDGGVMSESIVLCPKDDSLKENIYSLLESFADCRVSSSGSTSESDEPKEENVKIKTLQSCSLIKPGDNPEDILEKHSKDQKLKEVKSKFGDQIWSPAPLTVPGAAEEEKKDGK